MVKDELKKLIDDVHYLIVAHCKYKDVSMYLGAMKQFQKDIGYGQLEEMSYDERFAFLLGFETSLKAIENAIALSEQLKENPDMIKSFSSLLPQQEDAWKMKCPYGYGDEVCLLDSDGEIISSYWDCRRGSFDIFNQGNIFPTGQAAELEVKRRNLLTRFRAFRDECNNGWKPDWNDIDQEKHIIRCEKTDLHVVGYWTLNGFNLFGCFKDDKDAQRAIELFGDEIIELFVDCEV